MPKIETKTHYTHDEWVAEGIKRFGKRPTDWRFVCPACGNTAGPDDFANHGLNRGDAAQAAATECLGNYEKDIDCDWKAYGLFRGPVFVQTRDQTIPAFDFAEETQ